MHLLHEKSPWCTALLLLRVDLLRVFMGKMTNSIFHRQLIQSLKHPLCDSSLILSLYVSTHSPSILLIVSSFFFSVWWGEWSLDSEGDNISDVRKVQPHMSGVDEGRLCEVRPIPHGLYSSRRRDHQPAIPPLHHHHSQHHGHWFMSVVIYSKVQKYYVFLSEVSFATIIARGIPRASGILWLWLSGMCDPT